MSDMKYSCVKVIVFITLLFVNLNGKKIHQDICSNNDDKSVYIELGETQLISAKNVTYLEYNRTENQNYGSFKHCQVELIACPACSIFIKILYLNISENCNKHPNSKSCHCDHIWIYEPFFKELSGQEFCGAYINYSSSQLTYKSKTRTAVITFLYKRFHQYAFDIEYTSERNEDVLEGIPTNHLSGYNETQFISTPYFPNSYLRDLIKEYTIKCVSKESDCRVQLIFTDFLIARMSVIEVFDSNGKILYVATGVMYRPSAIVSSGRSLTVRFFANGVSAEGFKAAVLFLHVKNPEEFLVKPNMNCGGLVDNLGGDITMMNIVKESTTTFDCVWILQPSRNYLHFYTHYKLSIIEFSKFVGNAELLVRQGSTSAGKQAETLQYPLNLLSRQKQYVVPISQGFYVRFKGTVQPESKLALAYTAFSYNDCMPETDFLCKNQRCIPIYLQCDGFDHCGDNSDEPASCFLGLEHRGWSHTSKFFFQKIDPYSQLPVAAVVFILCCFVVGLISLILAIIILILRVNGRRVRHQREMENHMQIVNDLLEQEVHTGEEDITIDDDPPVYENPPNYEELSKYKHGCSKQAKGDSSKRNRSSNGRPNCSNSLKYENGGSNCNNKIIPDSPPPAYYESNYGSTQVLIQNYSHVSSTSEGASCSTSIPKNNAETIQNFFLKRFSGDDFNILKKKLLQRTRKGHKSNKKSNSKKTIIQMNHWLSDSDIFEMTTKVNESSSDSFSSYQIQRSFSLDDL